MVRRGRPVATQNADGLWHVWITIGTKPNGRPHQRHIKRADKDLAEKAADELLDQLKSGTVKKAGAKPTVRSWMTTYLTDVAPERCNPGTIYDYESKMRTWVYPTYGAKRLDRFTTEDLYAIYSKMRTAGKAQSHRLKVHRIISRSLDIAHRLGHVTHNVAKRMDAPSVDPVRTKALAEDVALKILDVVNGGDRRNPERWSVAFAIGLRQGEALGLRWADDDGTPLVDLEKNVIHVWWQLRRRIYRHGCGPAPYPCGRKRGANCPQRSGGGLTYVKCKGKSARDIPIPPELQPAFRKLRARQNSEKLVCGSRWAAGEAVFTTIDGRLTDPRADYAEWESILAETGVRRVKQHITRHTCATLLLAQGVDIRVVQELLGHRDVKTTGVYTQDVDVLLEDAMKLTLLRPKKKKKVKIKGVRKGVLHAVE